MGFTNPIATELSRKVQLPNHILIPKFDETSQFLPSILTKACVEEQYEDCNCKEKRYDHNVLLNTVNT